MAHGRRCRADHTAAAGAGPEPVVYRPVTTDPPATVSLIARTSIGPAASAALLREVVRGLDLDLPLYSLATLRQATADADWNARVSNRMLSALTAIALLLAGVGLYAVTARSVGIRRREIGIRASVGAGPRQVAWMILRQAGRRVLLGTLAGLGGVLAWDAAFSPSARAAANGPGAHLADPAVLLAIAAVLSALSVFACLGPLRRAQAINPATALIQD